MTIAQRIARSHRTEGPPGMLLWLLDMTEQVCGKPAALRICSLILDVAYNGRPIPTGDEIRAILGAPL